MNWVRTAPKVCEWLKAHQGEFKSRQDIFDRLYVEVLARAVSKDAIRHGIRRYCAKVFREVGENLPVRHSWSSPNGSAAVVVTAGEKFGGSLQDFALSEKRQMCPVCQLPMEVRMELRDPHNEGVKAEQRLRYIKARCGVDLTIGDLTTHRNQRHEATT